MVVFVPRTAVADAAAARDVHWPSALDDPTRPFLTVLLTSATTTSALFVAENGRDCRYVRHPACVTAPSSPGAFEECNAQPASYADHPGAFLASDSASVDPVSRSTNGNFRAGTETPFRCQCSGTASRANVTGFVFPMCWACGAAASNVDAVLSLRPVCGAAAVPALQRRFVVLAPPLLRTTNNGSVANLLRDVTAPTAAAAPATPSNRTAGNTPPGSQALPGSTNEIFQFLLWVDTFDLPSVAPGSSAYVVGSAPVFPAFFVSAVLLCGVDISVTLDRTGTFVSAGATAVVSVHTPCLRLPLELLRGVIAWANLTCDGANPYSAYACRPLPGAVLPGLALRVHLTAPWMVFPAMPVGADESGLLRFGLDAFARGSDRAMCLESSGSVVSYVERKRSGLLPSDVPPMVELGTLFFRSVPGVVMESTRRRMAFAQPLPAAAAAWLPPGRCMAPAQCRGTRAELNPQNNACIDPYCAQLFFHEWDAADQVCRIQVAGVMPFVGCGVLLLACEVWLTRRRAALAAMIAEKKVS